MRVRGAAVAEPTPVAAYGWSCGGDASPSPSSVMGNVPSCSTMVARRRAHRGEHHGAGAAVGRAHGRTLDRQRLLSLPYTYTTAAPARSRISRHQRLGEHATVLAVQSAHGSGPASFVRSASTERSVASRSSPGNPASTRSA
jgi:hypothetical protein